MHWKKNAINTHTIYNLKGQQEMCSIEEKDPKQENKENQYQKWTKAPLPMRVGLLALSIITILSLIFFVVAIIVSNTSVVRINSNWVAIPIITFIILQTILIWIV